jgi:hypothetical protein
MHAEPAGGPPQRHLEDGDCRGDGLTQPSDLNAQTYATSRPARWPVLCSPTPTVTPAPVRRRASGRAFGFRPSTGSVA